MKPPSHIKYRLGIDLGTNSLGWCAIALDEDGRPNAILAAGSRIFSDGREPKSKTSLAIARRAARAMRRRRDRLLQRRDALLRHLVADGLLPADDVERKALELLDPFELRARALDQALPPFHIGRAIFHLNQRRGFKSNRKTDRGNTDDSGKIAIGVDRLEAELARTGARTIGEYLHLRRLPGLERQGRGRHNAVPSVRTRLRPETGEGAKGMGYDFYPGRALVEEEFNAICEAQREHHPHLLTPEVCARLHEIVFHQRPLKAPRVGKCTLTGAEDRLPKAHPLFQQRRLLEEVNSLEIVLPGQAGAPLTRAQRDLLFLKLRDKQKVSFESLRKTLKLDPAARFNKESESRTHLIGDEVNAQFIHKTRFGTRWLHMADDQQWAVVSRLREEEEEQALLNWLISEHGLSRDQAGAVAAVHLPQGHGRFGITATRALIKELRADVVVYSEAVRRAGFHHSDNRTGEVFTDKDGRPALPYYGVALERHIMPGTGDPDDDEEERVGRLTNPTVHIGLNQLRRTVNRLIRALGKPEQIAIELGRDLKLSEEQKKDMERHNAANRRDAERRSDRLREIGQPDTGANRALLRLWEELDQDNVLNRRCVYSGRMISIDMLFNGAVDVDHILPFSTTLDDSNGNKIVALREANRLKGKRTPFDARHDFRGRFGSDADWEEIAQRVARLPKSKRWRFQPDAMQRFQENDGFLARHLVDTQYLSRLAREYLETLYPDKGEGSGHVWASPGRMTEMVRRKLGLNDLLPDHNIGGGADQPKNRLDHRHHAIDAAVVAITDRALLQKMARRSGLEGSEGRERIVIPPPWDGFRDALRTVVNGIVVSHRPDHGTASKGGLAKGRDRTAGALHNDTAYGLTGTTDAKGTPLVVHRIPLQSLKPEHLGDDPGRGVRDMALRAALAEFAKGQKLEDALRRFPTHGPLDYRGIRRLRVIEPLNVIPVRDRQGRPYKGYKGDSNYRYDVWEMPDGAWQAEVVSMFDAHQPGWTSAIRQGCPTARKVLGLHRDDVLAVERDGQRELLRVVKFSPKQLALAAPNETGKLKDRAADPDDPFRYVYPSPGTLKSWCARQVRIDELGRVLDPGFPARTARRRTRKRTTETAG